VNYQQQRADAFSDLLRRLGREADLPSVTAAELGARSAASPLLAVLFTGDPTVSPESWDVAVVLPELLAACAGIAGCVLDPQQSASAATNFGVGKLPALVVLRHGEYLGVVEGMRDWQPFVEQLRRFAAAAPRPIPVAGIYTATRERARPA
jgi:hydrogenase-1 operon protein HyaE